jgi:hypothetical protein
MNRLDTDKVSFTGDPRSEDAVVEIAILLESRLLKNLEATARAQNMSAGTLVRCLLRDFLCYADSGASQHGSPKDPRTASLCSIPPL